jgi:hypothetical protein
MSRKALRTIDELPLFATDVEIGTAVVGIDRAEHWARVTVKNLEKQVGFPKFDEAHGGRYTPAVRRFYETFHGTQPLARASVQPMPEGTQGWTDRRSRRLG